MKTAKLISTGLYLFSMGAFVSSFFVVDNKKAVKRRYIALGAFGAAWGVELISKKPIKIK